MKTASHNSRGSKLIAVCGLFVLLSMTFTTLASAQIKSTLNGFKKPTVKKQKTPQRQLALRVELQDEKNPKPKTQPDTAQGKAASKKQASPKTEKKPPVNVSNERRKELMTFLEVHHKELKPLLNQLRKNRPTQYQSILRSLDNKVRQLRAVEKKSPERHQRMLKEWVIQSKIQLLSAQIAIKNTPKEKDRLRDQIRPLIEEQLNLRIEQVQTDADQAKAKFEKISSQLNALKAKRDDGEVARRMKVIERTSQRISAQHKKNIDKKKKEAVTKKNRSSESTDNNKIKKQD